ncbi:hypothetical protein CcaverHIS002_0307000 [Cutaneotrichosporon cavernicola]|nr:hypothetical protein CcaverHIS002_0307000 [Cutaneotrichosporon cavernicola]
MTTTQIHWANDEPYLTVPSHPHITITPYKDNPADLAALVRIANDPRVGKWSFGRPYPFSLADARKRVDDNVTQAEAVAELRAGRKVGVNPFTVVRWDGAYVGDLVLFKKEEWEVAYALDPEVHGRGVGTAVIRTVLEWAVAELGVRSVEATAQTANPASTRMLEKLDFERVEVKMLAWPEHNGGGEREVAVYRKQLAAPQ